MKPATTSDILNTLTDDDIRAQLLDALREHFGERVNATSRAVCVDGIDVSEYDATWVRTYGADPDDVIRCVEEYVIACEERELIAAA